MKQYYHCNIASSQESKMKILKNKKATLTLKKMNVVIEKKWETVLTVHK